MRRKLLSIVAICATILAACEKTSVDSAFFSNGTVKAIIPEEEAQTRTALNGSKIIWSENDKISIFTEYTDNSYKNNKGTITSGAGTTSADFNVVYEAGYTTKVLAVYPYDAETSYDGSLVTINMPNSYQYTEGSINGFPMAAKISDQNAPISFKNAGALMQLTVNNIPAGYNSATLAANTQIAGKCKISFTDGIPFMNKANNDENNKKIEITWEPSNQMTNKTFYFPLPIYSYDNLTFSISNGSQTIEINSKQLAAHRSKRYTGAWTLGVASGSTPDEASSAQAATEALASGATAVNVTIGDSEATPTLSLPKQTDPESTPTTLSFSSIPEGKTVTIKDNTDEGNVSEMPSKEVYVYASSDTNSNNSFDINLPKSTVTLNATSGTAIYDEVTALTANNTLVVGEGVTINDLIIKGGNVRVRGCINKISRHANNENPVYLYLEEGADIPTTLPEGIQVATMVNNAAEFKAAVEGSASYIVLGEHFMDVPEILTIDRPLTLDGNGKNIGSAATRAINVDTDGVVNIKNLSITNSGKCERGINIINKAGTTNIDNVTISPLSHYAVHLATSAGAAKVNITNSNLTSWGALAVYGEGTTVTVTDSNLTGKNWQYEDNNSFATIGFCKNSTITVNGGTVTAVSEDGMDNMAIIGAFTGVTGANIYLNANLLLEGLNTCYISMPLEGNTLKVQNQFTQVLRDKYQYNISEPDADSMVEVTPRSGVAVINQVSELYDAAADENIDQIVLAANIPSITETVEITRNLGIWLNGYNFVDNVTGGRAFKVTADNVQFNLNASGSNISFGNGTYGIVEIVDGVDNATVTITGGIFNGTTDCGALVRFRNCNNNTVTLNDIEYTDNCALSNDATNAWVVSTDPGTTGNKLIVYAGTYNSACGFSVQFASEFTGVTLTSKGLCTEFSGGDGVTHKVKKCVITLDPGALVYTAPGACVAASNMATVNVINSKLIEAVKSDNTHALAVYTTGGTINYDKDTVLDGDKKVYEPMNEGKTGSIKYVETITE